MLGVVFLDTCSSCASDRKVSYLRDAVTIRCMAAAGPPIFPAGPQDRTLNNFMDSVDYIGPDDSKFSIGEEVDVFVGQDAELFVIGEIRSEDDKGYTVRFRDPDPTMNDEGEDFRDMRVPLKHAGSMIRKRTSFVPGPSAVPKGPNVHLDTTNPYMVDRKVSAPAAFFRLALW